ncbi:hypothetical protein CKAH01_15650 [Colletotrichum kahawae]|uniref:Uncharacterized protein n=1 Tax=Colletotrichum kahawae TaxID=34407 RepID=A0AAD9YHU0_COLKA|nr:hypothetical protein CKAH01_15650 [Colletotrichum kahawae]
MLGFGRVSASASGCHASSDGATLGSWWQRGSVSPFVHSDSGAGRRMTQYGPPDFQDVDGLVSSFVSREIPDAPDASTFTACPSRPSMTPIFFEWVSFVSDCPEARSSHPPQPPVILGVKIPRAT